jgi:hypothetical protein
MPAPDVQTLYDFETQLEGAWADVFEDKFTELSITCAVGVSRDADVETTPRVEVVLNLGGPLTQQTTIGQARPKQVPNAFTGTLTVSVITTRETNASSHGPIRGVIRYLMSGANQIMTEVRLPYLQILDLQPAGSAPTVNPEKNEDSTELVYAIIFAIRNEAWPASS